MEEKRLQVIAIPLGRIGKARQHRPRDSVLGRPPLQLGHQGIRGLHQQVAVVAEHQSLQLTIGCRGGVEQERQVAVGPKAEADVGATDDPHTRRCQRRAHSRIELGR